MAQKCSMFKMHGIFSAHSFSFSICVLTTAVTLPAVGMKNLSMSKTVTSSFWLVPNWKKKMLKNLFDARLTGFYQWCSSNISTLKVIISGWRFLLVILTILDRWREDEGRQVPGLKNKFRINWITHKQKQYFGPGFSTTNCVVLTSRWQGDNNPVSPTRWHAARWMVSLCFSRSFSSTTFSSSSSSRQKTSPDWKLWYCDRWQ